MPIALENFFQALVAGILVGGMYGLMCVGLGLIFGVMRVINFAQGDFLMLGMYVAYYLATGFGILAFGGAGSVFLNQARSYGSLVAAVVVIGLCLFMSRSRLGKTLRAAADNPEAATYMGIDVDAAYRVAFALGIALTAIAGGLVATYYPFQPYVGLEFVIIMYAGVVLGGFGSIVGAFWGGLIIGLVQQLSTLVLPVQLQNAAIFVVFLLIVFVRPEGLFGHSAERV